MSSTNQRGQMRHVFYEAWRKHRNNLLSEPLESMIIEIILMHPEYHELFDNPLNSHEIIFNESNPFLHISLHLALREQITTDRPKGIRFIFENLAKKFNDNHLAEHRMLECLEQILWDAQQTGNLPDEHYYLEVLRKID